MPSDTIVNVGNLAYGYALTYGPKLVGAILFLLAAWIIAGWFKRLVARGLNRAKFDPTLGVFFANAVRWVVLGLAVLACLGIFGIQTTSFAAVIGAGGLGIGLAFQGTLSNVAAGVMLLVFRPFGVGDIVTAGGVTGKVAEIGLFTTDFDTPDNRRMIVPNNLIFGTTIENGTHHPIRRVSIDVGADYTADIDATRQVLERAAGSVSDVLEDPAPQVFLASLGGSSVDWQLRVWCATEAYWEVHQATIRAIKHEMDAAGIGIPCPQVDVHVDGSLAG